MFWKVLVQCMPIFCAIGYPIQVGQIQIDEKICFLSYI